MRRGSSLLKLKSSQNLGNLSKEHGKQSEYSRAIAPEYSLLGNSSSKCGLSVAHASVARPHRDFDVPDDQAMQKLDAVRRQFMGPGRDMSSS
jgi:hypothetical protein